MRLDLLLATCVDLPAGEPGHEALDAALARRGVRARWAVWSDDAVDWGEPALVAVRSTWDYTERLDDFLCWSAGVGARMLHGSHVFGWNTDKRYLLELADRGVPVVPTTVVDPVRAGDLGPGTWVAKPPVGANGIGLHVLDAQSDLTALGEGPWLVQPFIETVTSVGETSIVLVDSEPVAAVQKTPRAGEFRVHEEHGGASRRVPMDPAAVAVARSAVGAAAEILGCDLRYARADLLRHHGQLVLNELELTEPGLYLDVAPDVADPFADMVVRLLNPTTSL